MITRAYKVGAYPLLIGMAFVWVSCTGAVPHISKPIPDVSKTLQDSVLRADHIDLENGRSIYVRNCAGCHDLHPTAEYTKTEWQNLFGEMSQKAHLTTSDSTAALTYLITTAKPTAAH